MIQLRILQTLLFLLAAVPCGIPFRWNPNPVFPSELAAFVLCVLITLTCGFIPNSRGEKSNPPWTSLIWIAFAGLIGIQALITQPYYNTEVVYPIIYALGAGGVAWGLSRAFAVFDKNELVTMFAWGLLAGSIFNSGLAIPQIMQLVQEGPRLIFGNIGQKNLYGHYLAWGLASAAYLVTQKDELPKWMFWIVAPWLALSLAFCGSRSPFLYAFAWLPAGLFLWWRGGEIVRQFGKALTIAAALIIVMQFIAPVVNELLQAMLKAKNEVPTGLDRIDSNGSRRLVEWHKAWLAFLAYPWTGIGWGAFGAQSVALQVRPEFAIVSESVLFTHAHNSVLNLLAETGIFGGLIILGGILWAFCNLFRQWNNPIVVFGASLAVVSLLHSLVEYPLWYFHFLGPFAVALFFLRSDAPNLKLPTSAARVIWTMWGGVALTIAVLGGQLYLKIYPILDPAQDEKVNAERIRTLESMRHNPLIDFYADYGLSNYIVASDSEMPWKLSILRHLNALRPYPGQMTDQAVMEALSGNQAIAQKLMRQAAFSYPESYDYFYETLFKFEEPAVRALVKEVDEGRAFFNAKLDFKLKRPVDPLDTNTPEAGQ
ncbi:Wzy polymerase domain-containing protein [Deefgea tanakiae]|uniref:Wzy polymerase domain-containing protein n=1 Tax=Deefgea tanakiae TaxID=2865840 RepID=A0ABX8Z4I4_9NEIS|nr:O-antigen ligase family protein [Deefgea tanakiae]QZA77207.1 Wzy polymerase domain-containing protein [Deefgea tanakiae]